jgi:hypothetical protein
MFRYFSNGGEGWSRLSLRDSGVIQAGRDSRDRDLARERWFNPLDKARLW